ncbi:hypothetical protein FQN55_001582 [Onygenales sp. PD_40]|nr:hypothetical protein FQN55_001582 [Onygenales sp. PD_40]
MATQPRADQTRIHPVASSPHLQLRAAAAPFKLPNPAIRNIQFLHPAYPENENILLVFPAFDSGGVHHETARVACAILANCRWDGYLSTIRNGPRLTLGVDGVLTDPIYYFCVDEESDYPVIPSFEHFRFPSRLPDSWSSDVSAPIQPATSDRISDRDQTCRITCSSLPNEIAHIIPAAQEEWWRINSMFLHTARPWSSVYTNCPENAILLRRDLHYIWDSHQFAVVPKRGRWVVHILDNQVTDELQERYHNLETQPIIGVAREYLFARFALAILGRMSIFTKQGFPRKLIIMEDNSPQLKNLSSKECRDLFGPPNTSRSQSPKKRQRPSQLEQNQDDDSIDHNSTEQEEIWLAGQWGESYGSDPDDEQRGRSKKRRCLSPGFSSTSAMSNSTSMPSTVESSLANSSTVGRAGIAGH